MKQIIACLFILCCFYSIGKAQMISTSDSLLQVYHTQPRDTARLMVLCKVIGIEQNNLKCIQFSDTLMKEALRLNSDKYACLSAYYHMVFYYNQCQQDSIDKWINIIKPYAKSSGLWNYYFDAKRFQIDLYTYYEQFEKAISEANTMKKKAITKNNNRGLMAAYQCLSNAYIGSQRWNEGLKELEKAYQLLTEKESPVVRLSILTQLISVTKEMRYSDKQLKYMQELEIELKNHIRKNPSYKKGYADVFIFNELYYALYYLNANRLQDAYKHLKQADKYLAKNIFHMYKVLYFDTYASYYQQSKQYKQALSCIDTTLTLLTQKCPSNYAEQLLRKAQILVEAGESDKALPLYQQVLVIKDSTATILSNKQMEQIKSNYKLDKITMEQDKQNNEIRFICLMVILLISVVLFIVMYRAYMVRKALKLSEYEIRKSADTVRNANEIKNRFLSNMSYNIRTPLNNVVGFSQLIATDPDMDEETRDEYSRIIHQSSEYLMKLVNDVLDLSRLEARMMKFQMQVYDIVELCREACYMAQMRNTTNGIQVHFFSDIESLDIKADTSRFIQALLSTLTYPEERQQKRNIRFTLSRDENSIYCRISNTPLADAAFTSQETYIRNDINRMLFEYFGGSYQVSPQTLNEPEIVFTYPITIKSE